LIIKYYVKLGRRLTPVIGKISKATLLDLKKTSCKQAANEPLAAGPKDKPYNFILRLKTYKQLDKLIDMMKPWTTDEELFRIAKAELFPALVGDVLDKAGLYHQFLPPAIKPVSNDMVLIGRAYTVLEADVFEELSDTTNNPIMNKPLGLMFEALDKLQPNDVYVCTGASPDYALWGGLMSTRALLLKAAGAIVNGYSRDTNEVLQLNFPTFSIGTYAQDQGPRGKVIDYGVPIKINGVSIKPGDIIFGDRDGVVIVPKQVEDEIFTRALEKARGEKQVKKALQEGMSTMEAFEKFGIM
jgi:regulator of RNase E activity RraA